ncbi:O-antigen ligase [Motilibacter rhizosphaerae]|uniref:O-antigen ligase n=1 Tax=Motilibacter rhizosphaerae TaxID=598652 RepID=A0A4Q7NRU4_9ACTN|nr:O-antigen ligase family protein [Motilibacter rhizosphaerae]RZS87370.1 O-antigen ligase [Motilibacter rhizosphaerae]
MSAVNTFRLEGPSVGTRSRSPFLVAVLCAVVAVAASTGIVASHLFSQQSTLKYALTVAGPVAGLALAAVQRRSLLLVFLLTVMAPFSVEATFSGVSVTPLFLLLVPAAVAVYLRSSADHAGPRSTLRSVGWVALAAASTSLLRTSHPTRTLTLLCVTVVVPLVVSHVVVREEQGRTRVAQALVCAASLQAVLALYEVATQHRLNLYGGQQSTDYFFAYEDTFRPAAAMPDPISLGNLLALSLPIVLVLGLSAKRAVERAACAVVGVVLVTALAFTLSRMSWIGATVGIVLALAVMPRRTALRGAGSVAGLGLLAIAAALSLGGPTIRDRFASILRPTGAKVSTQQGDLDRLRIWHAAKQAFWEHQWTGLGFGNIDKWIVARVPGQTLGTHAHDAYLNVAAEAGVVGLAALVLVLLAAWTDIFSGAASDRLFAAGTAGALGAVMVGWATDYTVRLPAVMAVLAVLFGLISGTARLRAGAAVQRSEAAGPGTSRS